MSRASLSEDCLFRSLYFCSLSFVILSWHHCTDQAQFFFCGAFNIYILFYCQMFYSREDPTVEFWTTWTEAWANQVCADADLDVDVDVDVLMC